MVSDALFYELITDKEPSRSRHFAKFPPGTNPVDLVSHIGELMRLEIESGRPAGKPSEHRLRLHFELNTNVNIGNYQLPADAEAATQEKAEEIRQDVNSAIELANTIPDFFPDLLVGSHAQQQSRLREAEKLVSGTGNLKEF